MRKHNGSIEVLHRSYQDAAMDEGVSRTYYRKRQKLNISEDEFTNHLFDNFAYDVSWASFNFRENTS